jgi:NAD-dependent deacetylase
MEKEIYALREVLGRAKSMVALTGAGVSAESGVPTFRGDGGLWKNYQATDLATPEAFARDPELVWAFYNWRRDLISRVQHNAAHRALARLELRVPAFTLITQNVDGLHHLAGSRNVLEIHGTIWKVRCTRCQETVLDRSPRLGPLPECRSCGGLLRPAVVWFGEALDPEILRRAVNAARKCEVMLVIGTSSLVQPAASLSLEAKSAGALVAEINLETTPHSRFMDFTLQGKAGVILPELLQSDS